MNKEITIIEIINKMANNENIPKRIKYKNIIWKYIEENEYRKENEDYWLFQDYFPNNLNFFNSLNDKVEILEEYEDIKEIGNYPDVLDWKEEYGIDRALLEQSEFNEKVFNRLNELAKEVNKLRKDRK